MKPTVFFIDPQSYNNLAVYDDCLLSNMTSLNIYFYGNDRYDRQQMSHVKFKPVFKYSSKRNCLSKGLSYLFSIYKIVKDIKSIKPDIVHIQWIRIWSVDYLLAKWIKSKGIKTVFTAHNIFPHDSGNRYKHKYLKYYGQLDHIIVHSEFTRNELNKIADFVDKVSVVPHGILEFNLNHQELSRRVNILKDNFKINDEIIFSSLGIQSHYKGTDLIIDAWKSDKNLCHNKKCKLLLIGKNNNIDYSKIREFQNVIVVDEKLSDLDFQSWFIISSIVLLPYREISQSGILFNALALNKPVLVSDAGGLKEPLKYGNVGWNIGEASVESIREFFLYIIDHPNELKQQEGNADFEKIKNIYGWKSIAIKTEEIYRNILN